MMEELSKNFRETIDRLPPLLKLPIMLSMIEMIHNELPQAEKDFLTAKDEMLEQIIEMVRGRDEND